MGHRSDIRHSRKNSFSRARLLGSSHRGRDHHRDAPFSAAARRGQPFFSRRPARESGGSYLTLKREGAIRIAVACRNCYGRVGLYYGLLIKTSRASVFSVAVVCRFFSNNGCRPGRLIERYTFKPVRGDFSPPVSDPFADGRRFVADPIHFRKRGGHVSNPEKRSPLSDIHCLALDFHSRSYLVYTDVQT